MAATRHSRCTNIRTPCMSCDRELELVTKADDDEDNLDIMEQGRAKPIPFSEVESHVAPTPVPKRVRELRELYNNGSKN